MRESPWSTANPAPILSAPTTIVRSFSSSKSTPSLPDARLPVEHGPAVLELDRERGDGEQRARDDEPGRGRDDVEALPVQRGLPLAACSSPSHVAGTPRRR